MAIEIANLCLAMGSVNANGTTQYENGAKTTNIGAGLYNITMDGTGVDDTEMDLQVTIKGATAGFVTIASTSDTVKNVNTFSTAGAATNLAFNYMLFQKPSTP